MQRTCWARRLPIGVGHDPTVAGVENTNLWRRRAIIGVLLDAGGPVGIGEIVARLGQIRPSGRRLGNKDVSDALRYQARLGRIRRVQRGVYVAIPSAMSASMRWRCRSAALDRR